MKASALLIAMVIFSGLHLKAQKTTLGINLEEYKYRYKVFFDSLHTQKQKLAMAYMYEKVENSRGTVVLMHGKNFNGDYWGETMQHLLQKGYNVFVPDQIGFGKSSKPANYQYSFQQLALNTKTILDNLNINKIIIIGHSMGGMLATRFSLMFPEMVQQLILENPIGLEDWKKWVPYQTIADTYKKELGKTREAARKYMQVNYFNNQWKSSYDNLVYLQTAFIEHPDYPVMAWNAALTYDMIVTQPVVYEFANLKVPTVLIIGQLDKTAPGKENVPEEIASTLGNYPKLGREVSDLIPKGQLVELNELGHIPHIEDFPAFFQALMKVIKP